MVKVAVDDTVHVKINGCNKRVQFIGINCPEIAYPDLEIKST